MNKLSTVAYGVITLVVIVILIFTIAIPVIEDAQKEQTSVANNTNAIYAAAIDNENVTLYINNQTGHWVINGVEDTQDFLANADKAWGENICIFIQPSSDYYVLRATYYDTQWHVTAGMKQLTFDGEKITITLSNDSTVDIPSNFLLYPDSKGTYAVYKGSTSILGAHINNDATAYIGMTGTSYAFLSGDKTNGYTQIGGVRTTTDGYDTVSSTPTYVESDDGLSYKYEVAPTIVLSDSTETLDDVTSDSVEYYVPLKYTYISSSDSMIIALLGVIPLILAIVPVMLAVQLMTGGRRD